MSDLSRPKWRKSARSGGGNDCVEIARLAGTVGVRDSKNPTGQIIAVSPAQWRAFAGQVKKGQHDL